jgi:hypothetical protein
VVLVYLLQVFLQVVEEFFPLEVEQSFQQQV